jgi:hypothetical protein
VFLKTVFSFFPVDWYNLAKGFKPSKINDEIHAIAINRVLFSCGLPIFFIFIFSFVRQAAVQTNLIVYSYKVSFGAKN